MKAENIECESKKNHIKRTDFYVWKTKKYVILRCLDCGKEIKISITTSQGRMRGWRNNEKN